MDRHFGESERGALKRRRSRSIASRAIQEDGMHSSRTSLALIFIALGSFVVFSAHCGSKKTEFDNDAGEDSGNPFPDDDADLNGDGNNMPDTPVMVDPCHVPPDN